MLTNHKLIIGNCMSMEEIHDENECIERIR